MSANGDQNLHANAKLLQQPFGANFEIMNAFFRQQESLLAAILRAFRSLGDSAMVLLRRRQNQRRLLLLLVFITSFINRMAFAEEKSLIGIYTKLSPFHWTTEQLTTYKTIRPFARKANVENRKKAKRFCVY